MTVGDLISALEMRSEIRANHILQFLDQMEKESKKYHQCLWKKRCPKNRFCPMRGKNESI